MKREIVERNTSHQLGAQIVQRDKLEVQKQKEKDEKLKKQLKDELDNVLVGVEEKKKKM